MRLQLMQSYCAKYHELKTMLKSEQAELKTKGKYMSACDIIYCAARFVKIGFEVS